jgi:amino acid adenylation domain-containing protein
MSATFEEQIIWDRYQLNRNAPGLVLSYRFKISGNLDVKKLEIALCNTVKCFANSLLNSYSRTKIGIRKKKVFPPKKCLHLFDENFSLNTTFCENQIDIEKGKLFYFALKSSKEYELFLSFSHIAFDGLSYTPFIKKLSELYDDGEVTSPQQEQYRNETNKIEAENYWAQKIKGIKLRQKLPFQFESLKTKDNKKCLTIKFFIQEEDLDSFNSFCSKHNATHFHVITMLFGILLCKYCREDVLLSYTATTNKQKERVGCYLNLLPLVFYIKDKWTIGDCIEYIKNERKEAKQYQNFPFKKILEFASLHGDGSIFNVIINESNGLLPQDCLNFANCFAEIIETPDLSGPYDLSFTYSSSSQKIIYAISAPISKMTYECLEDLGLFFQKALKFCLNSSSNTKIESFDVSRLLSPILSGDGFDIPQQASVIDNFLRNVDKYSDKIAISCNGKDITYNELNTLRTNILKRMHKQKKLDVPIAFLLNRTELLPATILAALSAGQPYVPIDTKFPLERIRYILESSGAQLFIVDDANFYKASAFADICKIINVSQNSANLIDYDFKSKLGKNPAAYILFTSGSTGKPKGVVVTQRNLINFICSMVNLLGITPDSRIIAITSVGFDISMLELVLPLFIGATIELISEEITFNLAKLGQLINNSHTNFLQATPATFRGLRSINWKSENELTILCGGEALDEELTGYLLDIGSDVYNMYGPTETTVWSSFSKLHRGEIISIGAPVFNTKYFVVDENFRSVPTGISGQLLISGEAVSNGYINVPKDSNFKKLPGIAGKVYSTGDIVKYFGDGMLCYVGRSDNQYKINGYRVDLAEIHATLSKNYKNVDFFVVVRENKNTKDKSIVCFYANDTDTGFNEQICREKLQVSLPHYMIPNAFYKLNSIPLNTNGKADVKFLSEADLKDIILVEKERNEMSQKKDDLLQKICDILSNTLNIDTSNLDVPLGILGLDSVLYTQLSVILEENFGIQMLPHEFYSFSTLGDLTLHISRKKISSVSEIEKFQSVETRKSTVYVLGLSILLPQNLGKDEFWDALVSQKNLISLPPKTRNLSGNFKCGYLFDIDSFDYTFFSISALEASNMDPRQKKLLQIAWETIEDAGIARSDLSKKKVGCYVATTGGDYINNKVQNVYSLTGSSMSILSNRISRFFDWRGPSVTVDTACSGSLVALTQAYNDLMSGVCDFAFVGSANIIWDDSTIEALKIGNFLSPNFRCATFDASADGYVRSEGVCGVFLARSDAQFSEDYDNVARGIIKSAAMGHGGKSNSLTAPNINALTELYLNAYNKELMQEVSYIETHGTGTKLGDPIEITSLKNAWDMMIKGGYKHNVYLGAVKSNIGHLEASAGLASIAKVLLSFEYHVLPSNIHFSRLNSEINLSNTPFKILEENVPWNFCKNRVAGVSSFGFGGMNTHVVVTEPQKSPRKDTCGTYIIPISARSASTLQAYVKKFRDFLQHKRDSIQIRDISYTLAIGRSHFEYRTAFIVNSSEELLEKLNDFEVSFIPTGKLIRNYKEEEIKSLDIEYIRSKFLDGHNINWRELFRNCDCRKLHLPTYAFNKLFK